MKVYRIYIEKKTNVLKRTKFMHFKYKLSYYKYSLHHFSILTILVLNCKIKSTFFAI